MLSHPVLQKFDGLGIAGVAASYFGRDWRLQFPDQGPRVVCAAVIGQHHFPGQLQPIGSLANNAKPKVIYNPSIESFGEKEMDLNYE